MKFEHTDVWGLDHALRGMRNPKNSWEKSDSTATAIGPSDLRLAKALISGGSEHRKFLRQIVVAVDITAPFYWWKEFDTYKVGTTANSCSTMHKILSEPITRESFEMGDYEDLWVDGKSKISTFVDGLIDRLEQLRTLAIAYDKIDNKKEAKKYWKELIRWLPEGWLQKRTVTLNYENIYSIVNQRRGHKLTEWARFIEWAENLPWYRDFFDADAE